MDRPSREELELLHGRMCQALADTTRMAILFELALGPRHVSALVAALNQPQATVSRHLRMLWSRGLVGTRRIGTKTEYQLSDRRVIQALDLMRALLADQLEREAQSAARIRHAVPRQRTRQRTRGEAMPRREIP